MPRQAKYNEHVNDHQLYFCKEVEKRMGSIDVVENVNELANIIEQHDISNLRKENSMGGFEWTL